MPSPALDPWLAANLVCPRDRQSLKQERNYLKCPHNHVYPVVRGIPVMLVYDIDPTHSFFFSETQQMVRNLLQEDLAAESETSKSLRGIDQIVQKHLPGTNSNLYANLNLSQLQEYPIPELPMPPGNSKILLDIGCGWGRWSIAAARKNYLPIGIDPSLELVLAASRVSRQLGVKSFFVVGDARYLPFRDNFFDAAFSYSVLIHFSQKNVGLVLKSLKQVLKPGGISKIHLSNIFGLRSLYARSVMQKFKKPTGFEVRYWTPGSMYKKFNELLGPSILEIGSYFSQGQISDLHSILSG